MVDKKKKSIVSIVKDGWSNVLTGLGTSKDKKMYSVPYWTRTPRETAEALFSGDEIGGKIAEMVPFDAVRQGIEWVIPDDVTDGYLGHELDEEFKRLSAMQKMAWGWSLARAYGGAILLISIDDGMPLSEPVDLTRIVKINNLIALDMWDLQNSSDRVIADPANPRFGLPEFYQYDSAQGVVNIHWSRTLRFDGDRLPWRLYQKNNYWHDSIYGRLFGPIRSYASIQDAIATLLQEFNQPVFRIDGLSEALANDQDQLILKKLQTVNLARSVARAVVLDKNDEFANVSANVGGINDLVGRSVDRIVTATQIPHTRLLGESPSGLGATGQSEQSNYYDYIVAMQIINLRDPIEYLTTLIFAQQEFEFDEPEEWTFKFNPLWQMDTAQQVATRKAQAEIDAIYMQTGVYDSYEVAKNRFGAGVYSYDTIVEKDSLSPDEITGTAETEINGQDQNQNQNQSQTTEENR